MILMKTGLNYKGGVSMNMKNKAEIIGRFTAEPKCCTGSSGKSYMNFDLAVDKEGGKNEVDFIPCCAFGKAAEFISKHFCKGQMINCFGSIITSIWTDKNGEKQKQVKVKVTNVDFYGAKVDENNADIELTKYSNDKVFGSLIDVSDDIIDDDDFETI